ncbi:MAG: NAD(P)H-hydrate dehydratase [Armatimonadota bacterium]|nr:NAD(P)H-hydrate dehydratase [Armatimonadota bacterium]
MRLVTASEMAEFDRRAVEEYGIPRLLLMEHAGWKVAWVARALLHGREGRKVLVLAGKGNNGGDGLVAARHLQSLGIPVRIVLFGKEEEVAGEARINLEIAKRIGLEIVRGDQDTQVVQEEVKHADLLIDALLGTGFRGVVRGAMADAIEIANASRKPILAVDLPSGLDADTGRVEGPCMRAAVTVTMGLPKIGLFLYPGASFVGRLYLADIGFPRALLESQGWAQLAGPELVRENLPPRRPDTHKGDYGRVFLLAGSVGYTGAAALCALGAVRAGAGLVTLGVPETIYPIVGSKVTEAMPTPLPANGTSLSEAAVERVLTLAAAADVVAAGPGLSTAPGVARVIRALLQVGRPIVLDADALNVLAGQSEILRSAAGPVVITPHPGEMARLLGISTREVQSDRVGIARRVSQDLRVTVVLKGARTIVADPSGGVTIIPTGNPGMATGGMGDVLTGAIAALIGQGIQPSTAAALGAYLHGLAGDLLAQETGGIGLLASEVANRLPVAIARARSGQVEEPVLRIEGREASLPSP